MIFKRLTEAGVSWLLCLNAFAIWPGVEMDPRLCTWEKKTLRIKDFCASTCRKIQKVNIQNFCLYTVADPESGIQLIKFSQKLHEVETIMVAGGAPLIRQCIR